MLDKLVLRVCAGGIYNFLSARIYWFLFRLLIVVKLAGIPPAISLCNGNKVTIGKICKIGENTRGYIKQVKKEAMCVERMLLRDSPLVLVDAYILAR